MYLRLEVVRRAEGPAGAEVGAAINNVQVSTTQGAQVSTAITKHIPHHMLLTHLGHSKGRGVAFTGCREQRGDFELYRRLICFSWLAFGFDTMFSKKYIVISLS